MKTILLILLFAATAYGQRNEVSIFAIGNLNSPTWVKQGQYEITSAYRSSVGGGVEYKRWLNKRDAVGVAYTQNPSSALLAQYTGSSMTWPLMRYTFSALNTVGFGKGDFKPFLVAGLGSIVTHGSPAFTGWSADFALVTGGGAEYAAGRFFYTGGVTLYNAYGGCYEDRFCKSDLYMAEDLKLGIGLRF